MDAVNKQQIQASQFSKGAHNSYWGNISETVSTLWTGLKLTMLHFINARKRQYPVGIKEPNYFEYNTGIFTVRYPHEFLPVPDNGRYKLHNEIEDCIVCEKCAHICPVDCIDIESVRAVAEFGRTSDGTPKKIYAARFDIDMAKCCFCGLCTTVCPTECLTMTQSYDFSEYNVQNHNFKFGNLTPEQVIEKKKQWEEFGKKQEAAKAIARETQPTVPARPTMKPKFGPGTAATIASATAEPHPATSDSSSMKAKFKPRMKSGPGTETPRPAQPQKTEEQPQRTVDPSKPVRPVMKPRIPGMPKPEQNVAAQPDMTPKEVQPEQPKKSTGTDTVAKMDPAQRMKIQMKPLMKPKSQNKPDNV